MAIHTSSGEEYLVMNDSQVGDLYIPMSIITDAITHTADDGFDPDQIEAYIRNSMATLVSANPEAEGYASNEGIPLDNAKADRSWGLVINDKMYSVDTDQFGTLSDLAVWMSETLNQAVEHLLAPYVARLNADLERAGFSQNDIRLTITT